MNQLRKRSVDDLLLNEKAIVGSAFVNPEVLGRIELTGPQFVDSELGKLWDLLKRFYTDGQPLDIALIMTEVTSSGIGLTAADIHELYQFEPHAANAAFYRDNIAEGATLRQLEVMASDISAMTQDATRSSEEIIDEASRLIDGLRPVSRANEAATIGESFAMLIEELDSPRERTLVFGFDGIDSYLGGMAPGELHIIGARPSRGKTAFGLQVAMHNAKAGRKVLFCALEMSISEMAKRVVCSATDVNSVNMRDRSLSAEERKQIIRLAQDLADCPLEIWTPHTATLDLIRRKARQTQVSNGLDLIVIDYLGLIRGPANSRQKRWELFVEISSGLKRLARELEVPILVLQQLGRDTDGRSPRLSDLRDSGSIEQDADSVTLIDYGEKSHLDTDDVVLDLAKNRHGQTGPFPMTFHKSKTQFADRHNF